MTTRSSVYERVQIGVEAAATPGVAVPANKLLQSVVLNPSIKSESNVFTPQGSKYPTVAAQGKEWTEGKLSSDAPCYDELAYLLAGLIGAPVITTPGGATNARLLTYTPATSTDDIPKTFTVEIGDKDRGARFPFGLITGLGLKFDRSKVTLSGDMIGQLYVDDVAMSTNATYTLTAGASPPTAGTFTLTKNAQTTSGIAFGATPATVKAALEALSTVGVGNVIVTATVATGAGTLAVGNNVYKVEFVGALAQQPVVLTGTFTGLTASATIAIAAGAVGVIPTAIPLVPVLGSDCSVSLADTQAALAGASPLDNPFSGSWDLTGKYGTKWTLNAANTSWSDYAELKPKLMAELNAERDNAGMGPLTQLRSGDTKWLRFKWLGQLVEAGQNYSLTIDMATKVTNIKEFGSYEGVSDVSWELTGVHDQTWGQAFQIALVCAVTAIS